MSKPTWHMCQNEECVEFRVQTKLLGGCGECSQALVAYLPAETPTVRQMAELASRLSTSNPDVPNLTVEQAETALHKAPHVMEKLVRDLGQLEGSINAHQAR